MLSYYDENSRPRLESLLSGSSRQEGRFEDLLCYAPVAAVPRCLIKMLGDKVLVRLVNLLPTSLAAQGQYVNTWRVQYKVGGLCYLV